MPARLADVLDVFHGIYDPSWAEPWDKVGLVCGDPDATVERIHFAVDPTAAVVREALKAKADLLIVHHPLLLTPVSSIAATSPKGKVVHDLIRGGCGLLTAHTNADTPEYGVNEAIAGAFGITAPRVLEPTDETGLDKLVTFVPLADVERVRAAITDAGAGRIGDYDQCTFTTRGEGRFRPLDGADPAVGEVGSLEVVDEARVESVFPRGLRRQVLAALRSAHPYEEPAYDVIELSDGGTPSVRGHGRIGELHRPTSLRELAQTVSKALPRTAHGVRVAGDPQRSVRTVAVAAGSGESLLETAARAGADVVITSDLKHHRVSEHLEAGGPAVIDVAHWAAEWTWLPVAEQRLREALGGAGYTVETHVSTLVTDPWSFRVDA